MRTLAIIIFWFAVLNVLCVLVQMYAVGKHKKLDKELRRRRKIIEDQKEKIKKLNENNKKRF